MDDGKGWYGESRRHSEAALRGKGTSFVERKKLLFCPHHTATRLDSVGECPKCEAMLMAYKANSKRQFNVIKQGSRWAVQRVPSGGTHETLDDAIASAISRNKGAGFKSPAYIPEYVTY